MKRTGWACLALTLALVLPGCSTDQRKTTISGIVQVASEAESHVGQIERQIKNYVEKTKSLAAKTDEEAKKPVQEEAKKSLEGAKNQARLLKKTGEKLQEQYRDAERYLNKTTSEEKKAFADEYNTEIVQILNKIDVNRRKLNQELVEMEKIDAQATKELRTLIAEAEAEFEKIARSAK